MRIVFTILVALIWSLPVAVLLQLTLKRVGKTEASYGNAYGTAFIIIAANSVLNTVAVFIGINLLAVMEVPDGAELFGSLLLIASLFGIASKVISHRHRLAMGRAALVTLTVLGLNIVFVLGVWRVFCS